MQYIIVGTGGQGVLFASKVLGHIAMTRGESVLGSEVHGMAQRGGSVVSHFKVGGYASPLVKMGDADLILAFDQNEAARSLGFLKDGGVLVVNVHDRKLWNNEPLKRYIEKRRIRVHTLEGYEILKEHMGGRFIYMNALILGAMCGSGVGAPSFEEVKAAVAALSPAKFKADNEKAVELGYEAVN